MNVLIEEKEIDNFEELYDLMTGQAKDVLDEVPEELESAAFSWISSVMQGDEGLSCTFSELWDYIAYDFDINEL